MGLASALSTALTGMSASETTIDVIGNNLSNSNTIGFKASIASFATQFLQTQSLGSAPTANNGGTDPTQIGLGTMVASVSPNFTQGTIQISSTPSDLAIQGDGFFIVQGSTGDQLYTRNGEFKLNSENQLVTTSGNRVMGFGVDAQYQLSSTTLQPVSIPLGSAAVAQATKNAYLQGTLSPTGNLSTAGTILQTDVLGDAGYTQPAANATATQAAPPATPTVAGAAGGGMSAGDKYSYRLVYVDSAAAGGNESPATLATAAYTLQAGESAVTLSGLSAPPAGCALRIYRTDNSGAGAYKLLTTLNTPGATWTDTLDDTNLGANYVAPNALTGTYTYYVTYATASGGPGNGLESRVTSVGQVTVNNGQIKVTLPSGDNSGQWSYMRLYRNAPSSGDSSNYYMAAEIHNTTTSNIVFTDDTTDTTLVTANQKLTDWDGPKANPNTLAVNLLRRDGTTYDRVLPGAGTLNFTGRKGDRTLTTKSYAVNGTTTTAQNLVDFMRDSMGIVAGLPDASGTSGGQVTLNGRVQFTGNGGVDNALTIDLAGMQYVTTGGATSTVNLPFAQTQAAVGTSAMTDFIAYDSLGIPLNVHLTAVLESRDSTSTTYRWFADSPQNTTNTSNYGIAVGTGLIKFDGTGNYMANTNSKVQIYRANVSSQSPTAFDLSFNQLSGLAADTSTMAVSRQDGSAPGTLNSYIVGEDGLIRGVFSNGVTRDLAQIRLARFSNPAGLQQEGENLYASGVDSGLPIEGNPGEQGIGKIVAGATELSNTDIGGSLIDLILASTMYRGNSRVITTVQQLFDELLNLRV